MIKRNIILIVICFSPLFATFINSETGWEFNQSSLQAFYLFESIEIDGDDIVGDGCSAQDCNSGCGCCEGSASCDVLGAFFNDVCVGWIYTDSLGWTTVPVMGDDGNSFSENYIKVH